MQGAELYSPITQSNDNAISLKVASIWVLYCSYTIQPLCG